jgi:hypothetical protein
MGNEATERLTEDLKRKGKSLLEEISENLESFLHHPSWQAWSDRVERVWKLRPKSYFPMYGTTLLARILYPEANLFVIKQKAGGYSARSICHDLLVPFIRHKGWHIKATGLEPLNNQPFFRLVDLKKDLERNPGIVRSRDEYNKLLREICHVQRSSENEVRVGLAAFLYLSKLKAEEKRKTESSAHGYFVALDDVTALQHLEQLLEFVILRSDGGKVGQALVAAALDATFGFELVQTAKVNDPSRSGLADVQLLSPTGSVVAVYEVKQRNIPGAEESFYERLNPTVRKAVFVDLTSRDGEISFNLAEAARGRIALRIKGVKTFALFILMSSNQPIARWLQDFWARFVKRLRELEASEETLKELHKMVPIQ